MLLEFKVDRCDGPHKDNLIGLALTSSQNQETQPNFHIDSEKIKQYLVIFSTFFFVNDFSFLYKNKINEKQYFNAGEMQRVS